MPYPPYTPAYSNQTPQPQPQPQYTPTPQPQSQQPPQTAGFPPPLQQYTQQYPTNTPYNAQTPIPHHQQQHQYPQQQQYPQQTQQTSNYQQKQLPSYPPPTSYQQPPQQQQQQQRPTSGYPPPTTTPYTQPSSYPIFQSPQQQLAQQPPQHKANPYSQQQNPYSQPAQKKKDTRLSQFLMECMVLGTLKGFRYFDTYLRGREELLVRIALPLSRNDSYAVLARSASKVLLRSTSLAKLGSQYTAGLPPASPAARELEKDTTKIAYLVAGYAKYKSPFVWIRSSHSHLIKDNIYSPQSPTIPEAADQPLRLKSIAKWQPDATDQVKDVGLYDVVEELVEISIKKVMNPFKIDVEYFKSISPHQCVLQSAGSIEYLRTVANACKPYVASVLEDIAALCTVHFDTLTHLMIDDAIYQSIHAYPTEGNQMMPATVASLHAAQMKGAGMGGMSWGGVH